MADVPAWVPGVICSLAAFGFSAAMQARIAQRRRQEEQRNNVKDLLRAWSQLKEALDAMPTDIETGGIRVGSRVRVSSEPDVRNNSLWDATNTLSCGKEGEVLRIDADGDVEVRFDDRSSIVCDLKFLTPIENSGTQWSRFEDEPSRSFSNGSFGRPHTPIRALIDDVDGVAERLRSLESSPSKRRSSTTSFAALNMHNMA